MSQSRQLAAIMFTDIVGYTALMQQDEMKAVAVIKHYNAVLEKYVATYHGNSLNNYGDGSLCSFPNTADALHCALKMQQELQSDPTVPLRIGLHVGEIFFEEGKVLGDGVNVASRIQSLGSANTILFSGEIQDKIKNHPEFKTVSLGLFEFKSVEKPVEVFALANDGLHAPARKALEGKLKEKKHFGKTKWLIAAAIFATLAIGLVVYTQFNSEPRFTGKEKSIAVLPFENIGSPNENEHIRDGITQDIIDQLGKIKDFQKVIPWASAKTFKQTKNIKQIAKELGVASIATGSVQKEANKLRFIVELIDVNTGKRIWGDKYDRNWDDVLAIQAEVAQLIAVNLNAQLTAEEKQRIELKLTNNPAAYEDYLKGISVFNKESADQIKYEENIKQAETHFLDAIKKDSTFALAWSSLGMTYIKIALYFDSADRYYYTNKALTSAIKGVIYGPQISETHLCLGDILKSVTLNPASALFSLRKAVDLNPNNADAYSTLAWTFMEMGELNEAEINLKRASYLNPVSGLNNQAWHSYYFLTRNVPKLKSFVTDFHVAPDDVHIQLNHIWLNFIAERFDSLLFYARQYQMPLETGIAYAKLGQTGGAMKIIDMLKQKTEKSSLGSRSTTARHTGDHVNIAQLYGWLNEKEKAMDYLELAYRLREHSIVGIRSDPYFQPLRTEERFKVLIKRIGEEENQ